MASPPASLGFLEFKFLSNSCDHRRLLVLVFHEVFHLLFQFLDHGLLVLDELVLVPEELLRAHRLLFLPCLLLLENIQLGPQFLDLNLVVAPLILEGQHLVLH